MILSITPNDTKRSNLTLLRPSTPNKKKKNLLNFADSLLPLCMYTSLIIVTIIIKSLGDGPGVGVSERPK